jgi:transposase InsO family protein/transposase-like protein
MGSKRKGSGAQDGAAAGGRTCKRYTPEERRAAVEAFEKSGLSQKLFAGQWGVSHVTLGFWLKRHREAGGRGLERVSSAPARRRGKAPLAEPVKAEIVATKARFPAFGLRKVRDFLVRFSGLRVSTGSVRKVLAAAPVAAAAPRAVRRRRRKAVGPPQRFERAGPNELWQSDITYVDVPWSRKPLYLVAFLDDHSRYVVAHGLHPHQKAEIVLEALALGISRYGRPKEVLTDQGRQYFAWRGKCDFQKRLRLEGIQHVVARAHHPMTVGKCERLWKTLQDELFARVLLRDLEDARARLSAFLSHYNFQRPHQSLEGLVPADRFFSASSEVRAAIEASVSKNSLHLALGETPRRPLYLAGQIDGQSVSVHGEGGRVVVQLPSGERREIEAKDLGIAKKEEASDERDEQDGGGDDPDDDLGAACALEPGRGPHDPAPGEAGAQANGVSGSEGDADAGAGALAGRERGGEDARPHDGERDPSNVARQGES